MIIRTTLGALALTTALAAGAAAQDTAPAPPPAAPPSATPPPAAPPPPPPEAVTPAPPPLPVETEAMYFAVIDGAQAGPFSATQVGEQLSSGAMTNDTFVWSDGMAEWRRISEVSDLDGVGPVAPPQFDQCQTQVVGGWRVDGMAAGYPSTTEALYYANGTYASLISANVGGFINSVSAEGTWTVRSVGEGRCALEVRETANSAGTAYGNLAQTFVLRYVDENRWFNETTNAEVYRTQ